LQSISDFWRDDAIRVLGLIGIGGAGKTALVAEFLQRESASLSESNVTVYVWSFYVAPDTDLFLTESLRFFSGGKSVDARGGAIFLHLLEALRTSGKNLLVLDGLERVQRAQTDASGYFGQLDDPLLGQIVSRLARGPRNTKCIITGRFPVSDLRGWSGREYRQVTVDQLLSEDARDLLRRRG